MSFTFNLSTVQKLAVTAMLIGSVAAEATTLHLYSARKEELIKPLLDQFTTKTGIEVKLLTGNADSLLVRLQREGRNTPADLLLTTDAGRLVRAQQADVLQAVSSDELQQRIPAQYRDPENYWFGLSVRARPFVYSLDRVNSDALSTYEDLTDSKWRGKICIRSSNNIYNQSLVASMIEHNGTEATQKWAEGLVANLARKPQGGDRDQIKAVAAGQCDVAVINSYYLGMMIGGNDEEQKQAAAKVGLFWPNQQDRGAHVNVSGIGVTKASKNRDDAIKLITFLVSDSAQSWYAEENYEFPVLSSIPASKVLQSWGTYKSDTLPLHLLGTNNAAAVKIMDRAGWQ